MRKLSLLIATLFLALTANAQEYIDGLYYYLYDSTPTAKVTCKYYGSDNADYVSGDLQIPETVSYSGKTYTVTSIGGLAFANCSGLTSVEIPNSVTSIGNYAFAFCSGLTSIEIPNSVTSIDNSAFSGCSNLKTFIFDEGKNSISFGRDVFADTPIENLTLGRQWSFDDNEKWPKSLKTVKIGNEVTTIPSNAFWNCSRLTSVTIGNSVKSIGQYAFYGCSGLTSVYISDLEAWCKIKFYDHSNPLSYAHNLFVNGVEVKDLIIPNSVTSIGSSAFRFCSGLTSVEIPNSVTSIGDYAFAGCSGLTSVEIPNSVKSIGLYAFYVCSGLTSVYISDLAAWCNIDFGNSYSNPLFEAHNLFVDGVEIKDLIIPNSVTSIGDYAFSYCSGLTSVEIPNSVTSIGVGSFVYCSGLTRVEIGNSVTSIGNSAFAYCSGLTSIEIPNSVNSIGDWAFNNCSNLTSVGISDLEAWCKINFGNVTSNPLYYVHNLFVNNVEIKDLKIPNSVTSIGDHAFSYCSGLTSVEIPNSVTSIGVGSFVYCSGLTRLEIPNSVTSIGGRAFSGCSNLNTFIIDEGNNSISFGTKIFADTPIDNLTLGRPWSFDDNEEWPISLKTVIIGNGVTTIPSKAFYNSDQLTRILIGNSVSSIGNSAFYGCSGLTSIEIPSSVSSIGSSAFYGCSGLKTIAFYAKGLMEINDYAFVNCDKIETIYCSTARPPVGYDYNVFTSNTYSNATLYVPTDQISLYYSMIPWSKFFNIIATDEFPEQGSLGVNPVPFDNRKVDVYNLNGTLIRRGVDPSRLDDLAPGLYIINGKKVMVK